MNKDFKIVKTQNYPLGVYFRHAGLHIAAVHRRTPGDDPAKFGIILYDKKHKNGIRIPFPEEGRVGSVYSMLLEGYQNREFSYLFYCGDRVWQDPYCRKTDGFSKYGVPGKVPAHCMVPDVVYDWEDDKALGIPYENTILYVLHVRGFTKHRSSGVKYRGTYAGLTEKIPYLKELGITSVLLMPAYEFNEIQVQENIPAALSIEQAAISYRQISRDTAEDAKFPDAGMETWKVNYWGFCKGLYYCPKSGYAHSRDAVTEYKDTVRELHRNGIEVLMQFYFPPEVAAADMLDILKYWTVEYHIDGFHVLGMDLPIGMFAEDPLLSGTKILTLQQYCPPAAACIDTVRNVGWLSDGFMYDMRRLLKGDDNMINQFIFHVRNNRPEVGIVNYMAKWEGFCLTDLVSYDRKHNEDNGEDNRDGTDYNCSWNCGVEGRSRKRQIMQLRMKQMKNALTLVFLAQGTPLLYSGDEFGNTQNGNNNPYCQDNAVTWIKWNQMESGRQLLEHTRMLIELRRKHPVLHDPAPLKGMDYLSCGYPDISFHGREAWRPDTSPVSRSMGVMYCGYYGETDGHRDESFIYFGINLHWETRSLGLPKLPKGKLWTLYASTDPQYQVTELDDVNLQEIILPPRTIVIYTTKECPVAVAEVHHRRKRSRHPGNKATGKDAVSVASPETDKGEEQTYDGQKTV